MRLGVDQAVDVALIDARFMDVLGRELLMPWTDAASGFPLERSEVVRPFPVRPGRRVAPGWWWSATDERLVHYGSGLMRTQLMLLDRDPSVVAVGCRPVELRWREAGGGLAAHSPHFLARLADGSAVLVDCVGWEGVPVSLARRVEVLSAAAAAVGWRYRVAAPPDPVVGANVRWLAGYRHPRCSAGAERERLLGCFSSPRPLIEGVQELGDPIEVLPMIFHALWRDELTVKLTEPLHERSVVAANAGRAAA